MRHLKKGRKFGREKAQREAFIRGLEEALIAHGKIKTTLARAKELRPLIEKKLTFAKKKSVANARLLKKHLSEQAVRKLINEIAPRFESVNGGYTRIIRLVARKTDGAQMAIISFTK